jgi:hypothetical protein
MKKASIESNIIHAVWSSVEAINKQLLLQLNDTDLIQQIMRDIDKGSTLTSQDRQSLIDYLSSKIMLIRDISDY